MAELEISELHVRTEVGFSPHEIGKLQDLLVTICLRTSAMKKAEETDRREDELKTITKEVIQHLENKKYNLIEAVATDVARICVVRHGAVSAKVNVSKLNALPFFKYSAVTIERCWADFDWHEVHVTIGSNIDPLKNLPQAIRLLKAETQLIKLSNAYRTTPVGYKEQADFVNMAAFLRTKHDPAGLKRVLYDMEHRLGRIRDLSNKSGPRTIDLDIAFWGDTITEYHVYNGSTKNTWSVPEPDTLKLAHLIIPLADVTPEFIHPLSKRPLRLVAQEVSGKEDFGSFFPTVQL